MKRRMPFAASDALDLRPKPQAENQIRPATVHPVRGGFFCAYTSPLRRYKTNHVLPSHLEVTISCDELWCMF